jgi:hypothetical protein
LRARSATWRLGSAKPTGSTKAPCLAGFRGGPHSSRPVPWREPKIEPPEPTGRGDHLDGGGRQETEVVARRGLVEDAGGAGLIVSPPLLSFGSPPFVE